MLYTVVPLDDVLEGIDQEPTPTTELTIGGVLMEVEPQGDFSAKVVRIISSNPQDYLMANYQPGSLVRWT